MILGLGHSYDCIIALKCKLGQEAILVVKTGHRKTPKGALDEVMKHWPAGSYVVFMTTDEGAVLMTKRTSIWCT